ncbi:MAG: glucokinase [Arhodomonas sp.]|nr:glucokinase [Arhodomonas sp.]
MQPRARRRGPGLVTLYDTLAALDGAPGGATDPEAITAAARRGEGRALECVARFTEILAAAAGDLALTAGTRGGIYLTGGILPALGELFDEVRFRGRFRAKGQLHGYLAAIPVWRVKTALPALDGLASAVRNRTLPD